MMEDRLQSLSYEIRGAAMEVYNHFGPGLLESLYEKAMVVELESRDIPVLFENSQQTHGVADKLQRGGLQAWHD